MTRGTFADWRDGPDRADIGMPVGECRTDGSLVVGTPAGTGGIVTVGTVAEQMLYEVNDPARDHVAEVTADLSGVTLEQIAPDLVALRVRPRAPTASRRA